MIERWFRTLAHDEEGIESDLDDTVFAISGKIADRVEVYKGIPVINALQQADRLANLIIEKVFTRLPDVRDECCRACGHTCRELCGLILSENAQRSDCTLENKGIVSKIKGKEIVIVHFVQKILQNAIEGIVKELEGYFEEEEMLRWLRAMGIKVPQVYFSSDKIMILEDLGYETLLDWYEQMEEENRSDYETIILQLISWLKSFYYSTKEKFGGQIVLKDINFRNFLVKD